MKVDELIAKAKESLDVRMVYAEPYERDGVTVIAAAKVVGGGGGGGGHDEKGQEGEGGGFGLTAKPAGAYIIKDGNVRWAPAVDVNRLVATMGVIAVAGLFVASRIARINAKGGQ
ncbi:spore germination protein GerW family protein [Actinocrispum sp. NPDC049592]|uniref:spore germination protein GerW family protein n=1 Tax=Actinocrispum sp. NPDC049592 TaxID=3154835 RepID=UPI003438760C